MTTGAYGEFTITCRRKRRETDEKYDYRYSQLLFVFARLLHKGRISESDLSGLRQDKLEKIRFLAGFGSESSGNRPPVNTREARASRWTSLRPLRPPPIQTGVEPPARLSIYNGF